MNNKEFYGFKIIIINFKINLLPNVLESLNFSKMLGQTHEKLKLSHHLHNKGLFWGFGKLIYASDIALITQYKSLSLKTFTLADYFRTWKSKPNPKIQQ